MHCSPEECVQPFPIPTVQHHVCLFLSRLKLLHTDKSIEMTFTKSADTLHTEQKFCDPACVRSLNTNQSLGMAHLQQR